jgi:Holliday junction resolvase
MAINSRSKGKVGERQWRDVLRAAGYNARRGQQFSGERGNPDVIVEDLPIHYEVKRCQVFRPYEWLEQASNDAPDGKFPTVAFRRNGRPWAILRWADHDLEIIRRSDLPK